MSEIGIAHACGHNAVYDSSEIPALVDISTLAARACPKCLRAAERGLTYDDVKDLIAQSRRQRGLATQHTCLERGFAGVCPACEEDERNNEYRLRPF